MEAGEWKIYFKSSIGVDGFSQYGFRSIRFASNDVWNESLDANYLGYVEITESNAVGDNTFGEVGKDMQYAHLYSLGGKVVADGQISDGEWTEDDIIAENGQYKLYAKADEENLYIMADMPHNAKSPVFNFSAKKDGKSYWLYQQSNGFIYFNHDNEKGHSGMIMRYSDNLFEFKIPFYMLDIDSSLQFSEISVNVQDSGDGWKSTGNIKTTESYTVTADFTVFNSFEKLTVSKGGAYETELAADADIANVVWYVDGVEMQNGNSAYFKLENIENDCTVSAKIITVNGTVKEITVAEIKSL